jgi:hypothetical protein
MYGNILGFVHVLKKVPNSWNKFIVLCMPFANISSLRQKLFSSKFLWQAQCTLYVFLLAWATRQHFKYYFTKATIEPTS